MKKRAVYVGAVALLLFAVLLIFVGLSGPTKVTNYPSEGETIIAFGDSLIEGTGASPGNDLPALLSDAIGEHVVNLGKAGDTTESALRRIGVVLERNPKAVIVLLGGNDFLRRIPRDVTEANLETIIESIHAEGAVVILLGVRGGILGDGYREMYEDLARKHGTAYVSNVLEGLLGNLEYMHDAIHPNDAGYRIISERIRPVLVGITR